MLDWVPLKYPGMAPWEIWISESQERMTFAVPPEKLDAFMELMQRREVEATVIGEFTDSGRCVVEYHGNVVMDVGLAFLHDGLPKKHLKTTYTKKTYPEPDTPCPDRLDARYACHAPAEEHLLQGVHLDPVRPYRAGRPCARPGAGDGPGAGSSHA